MPSYQINFESKLTAFQFDESIIRRIAELILLNEKITEALVNIVFVDDEFIINLNKEFLHKETTTDVISFTLEKNSEKGFLEGEVYANLEQVRRQAQDYDVSWQNELLRIVIHGVLHLTGYDDQSVEEKKQMTEKEDFYLSLI